MYEATVGGVWIASAAVTVWLIVRHRIRRLYYAPAVIVLTLSLGAATLFEMTRDGHDPVGVAILAMVSVSVWIYGAQACLYAKSGQHRSPGLTYDRREPIVNDRQN